MTQAAFLSPVPSVSQSLGKHPVSSRLLADTGGSSGDPGGVGVKGKLRLALYRSCEMRAWWTHGRPCLMEEFWVYSRSFWGS